MATKKMPCLDQDDLKKEALDLLGNPERFAIHGVPSGQDLKCYSSQRHADAFFES